MPSSTFDSAAPPSAFNTVAPPLAPGFKSYGDWIFERHKLKLPLDAPPPAGYETYKDWYERVRGLPFGEGASPTAPSPTAEGPSSYFRRMLLTAGSVASRLGAIGRSALPAFGAVSTIIHAIREGRDQQRAPIGEESGPRADVTRPGRPKLSKREPNGFPSHLSS
jgi:hypothetical protein